jgi:hypothetical protein
MYELRDCNEKNISTQRFEAKENAWLQGAHGN